MSRLLGLMPVACFAAGVLCGLGVGFSKGVQWAYRQIQKAIGRP